ncbi:MAG: glycerophosphodiester phosphodiesterase [Spirochaetaceae bacterium]|nr:MAG: glycerophosphodiester phosphodiesterase [Spirochaetaceae bacterium]
MGLAVLWLFLIAPARTGRRWCTPLFDRHFAHRGLHTPDGTIPENSLPAFAAACEAGYGIELDVQLSADGQVVVFHDDDLVRVCNDPRAVADLSTDALSRLRLFDTAERIPLLSEVLALVGGRVPLIVELKDGPRNDVLCTETARLLDRYIGPYCIESFHPGIVRWFRRNRSGVVRGQLSAGSSTFDKQRAPVRFLLVQLLTNVATRPHFVAFRHQDGVGRLRLRLVRLLGGALVGWTVKETDDRERCLRFFDVLIFEFWRPGEIKG